MKGLNPQDASLSAKFTLLPLEVLIWMLASRRPLWSLSIKSFPQEFLSTCRKCPSHPTPSFMQLLIHISSEKDLLYIHKIYLKLYSLLLLALCMKTKLHNRIKLELRDMERKLFKVQVCYLIAIIKDAEICGNEII